MSYSQQELATLKRERNLSQEQLGTLQRMLKQYEGKIGKADLLDSYRKFAYIGSMLEEDLRKRFDRVEEKPVRISYDLLPNGKVENFTVEEVDV